MVADPSPIGSDFPSPPPELLRERISVPPWGEDALLLQTGRQALALLADQLAGEGASTVAIPAFACESMLEPFQRRGWRILPYPVDGQLRPRLEAAADLVAAGAADAVLAIRYFGALPDAADHDAAHRIRRAGGYLIADETHHPFSPRVLKADAAFASLRKTLPLASGAYLAGRIQSIAPPIGAVDDRWAAMDSFDGTAAPRPEVRVSLLRANALLEASDDPRSADRRSRRTLERLDFAALALQRRHNARALIEALDGIGAVRPALAYGSEETPSHLPMRVSAPRALQRRLAARRIYCPVHWERPAGFALDFPWPDDLLSVPVDHRYTPSSMRRVADAIREEVTA